MWHPPLYIYSTALCVRLFGDGPVQLRLVGLLSVLAAAGMLFLLARDTAPGAEEGKRRAHAAVALYLLSPLAVQMALLLDIDNSVLTAALLAFLLFFHRHAAEPSPATAFRTGLAFGACLLAKMTTPLLLPVAAAAGWCREAGPRRATASVLLVFATGATAFTALLGGYCLLTGMPFDMPWKHNFLRHLPGAVAHTTSYGALSGPLFRAAYHAWMGKNAILWLSPFLLLLALPETLRIAREGSRSETTAAFLAWASLGGYIYVQVIVAGFPKYIGVTLPLMTWLAAPAAVGAARAVRESARARALGVASAVSLALFVLLFGDPFPQALLTYRGSERIVVTSILLGYGLPLAAGTALFLWIGRGASIAPRQCVALWLLTAWLGSSASLLARQCANNYESRYFYGQTGFEEVVARLKQLVRPGDTPLCLLDVAHYAGCDFLLATEGNYARPQLAAQLAEPRVSAVVYRVRELEDPARHPTLRPLFERYFEPPESYGSFGLMRRKGVPARPGSS
ncbi:MAG: glycosyltransferase family 39 protein [Candidatus Wallbacteria bacterium]|nr:glycosyltransferase family 39 protein [Candidatus Wallbacteria bacterium]